MRIIHVGYPPTDTLHRSERKYGAVRGHPERLSWYHNAYHGRLDLLSNLRRRGLQSL